MHFGRSTTATMDGFQRLSKSVSKGRGAEVRFGSHRTSVVSMSGVHATASRHNIVRLSAHPHGGLFSRKQSFGRQIVPSTSGFHSRSFANRSYNVHPYKAAAVVGGVGLAAYGVHKVWQRHQAQHNFNASVRHHNG